MASPTFTVNGETIPVPTQDDLMFQEAGTAEKLYGGTFQQLAKDAEAGSIQAIGVLLFIGYKRLHPDAKFSEFDFKMGELANQGMNEEDVEPAVPTEEVAD